MFLDFVKNIWDRLGNRKSVMRAFGLMLGRVIVMRRGRIGFRVRKCKSDERDFFLFF